jgi:tetratricopeptide (TPR) repeat protein
MNKHARWSLVAAAGLVLLVGEARGQPAPGERQLRAAAGLLQRGMPEQAIEEYRRYLGEHAEGEGAVTARYGLGVALARAGKPKEAEGELLRVLESRDFEFRADALLLLAQVWFAQGRLDAAKEALTRLAREHPEFGQRDAAAVLMGEVLYRSGAFAEARAALAGALAGPGEPGLRARASYFDAMARAGQGQDSEAASRLEALARREDAADFKWPSLLGAGQCRLRLGQSDRAAVLFREALAGPPEIRREAGPALAQAQRLMGDAPAALATLDAAPPEDRASDRWALERGVALLDAGRSAEAIDALARVADAELADDAAYWRARAQMAQGDHAQAAEGLRSAAQRFEHSDLRAWMVHDLGAALSAAGDHAGARRAFERVEAEFADHPLAAEALASRVGVEWKLGRGARAAALGERFLEKHAGHAREGEVRLVLGEVAFAAGRYTQAAEQYAAAGEATKNADLARQIAIKRGLALVRAYDAEGASALQAALGRPGAPGPTDAPALAALGEWAHARGDWAAAAGWYERLEAAASEELVRRQAALSRGFALHRSGDAAGALECYRRAAGPDGADDVSRRANLEIGQALADLNQPDHAAAALEPLVESGPDAAGECWLPAVRRLASVRMAQGRAGDAASLLERVQPSHAADQSLRTDLAMALIAAGRAGDAVGVLRQAPATTEGDAESARALAALGIALSRAGRHDEALAHLDRALASAALRREDAPAAALERAWCLRSLGRLDEALPAYAQLAREGPTGIALPAAVERAQLLVEKQAYAEAMDELNALDSAGRAGLEARRAYLRGFAQQRLGRHADAVKSLAMFDDGRTGERLAPFAWVVAGEAYLALRRPDEAAARFERAAEGGEVAVRAQALLRLGEARSQAREWEKSRRAFEAHRAEFPDSPQWFQAEFGIAWALENAGNHEGAIAAYRRVTDRHGGVTAARAQFQIGECLFAMGRLAEAAAELVKVDVLYASPEWSAAALFEAGRALAQAGDHARARAQFEQVITRFGESKWAAPAREHIEAGKATPLPGAAASKR